MAKNQSERMTDETRGQEEDAAPVDDIMDELPALKAKLGASRRNLYLPDSLWRTLAILAAARGVTISQIVRSACRAYIKGMRIEVDVK